MANASPYRRCRFLPIALAGTQKGLAVHALNLDLDFGPLLQTQKLLDSIVFARRKGGAEE